MHKSMNYNKKKKSQPRLLNSKGLMMRIMNQQKKGKTSNKMRLLINQKNKSKVQINNSLIPQRKPRNKRLNPKYKQLHKEQPEVN